MAKLINEEIGRVTVSAEGGTKIVMDGAGGGVNLVTGELYEVRDVAMEA